MGFEPTEPYAGSTVFKTVRADSRDGRFTRPIAEIPCATRDFGLSSPLVTSGSLASLLVLPRPQCAPRCSASTSVVSVPEGLEDVLHEEDEMEVVGR